MTYRKHWEFRDFGQGRGDSRTYDSEPEISAVTPLMALISGNWSKLSFNSEFFHVLRGIPQTEKILPT